MAEMIAEFAKRLDMRHNVSIRVIDEATGQVVSEHEGHNAATNSLLTGIGHYLVGEGVLEQGDILRKWVPQYISLGTMGLFNQEEDSEGLPAGIGPGDVDEVTRFKDYVHQVPGYGSDGYDLNSMNNRMFAGLGPTFEQRADKSTTVNCELITDSYSRSKISFRDVVPEYESEIPQTIDVVFSSLVSTGALAKFREPGKDYIFITEVGLWSSSQWEDGGDNGLLAGYRILPPDGVTEDDMEDPEKRKEVQRNIIKVKTNQIVQVIWKIQLGGITQFNVIHDRPACGKMKWKIVY